MLPLSGNRQNYKLDYEHLINTVSKNSYANKLSSLNREETTEGVEVNLDSPFSSANSNSSGILNKSKTKQLTSSKISKEIGLDSSQETPSKVMEIKGSDGDQVMIL